MSEKNMSVNSDTIIPIIQKENVPPSFVTFCEGEKLVLDIRKPTVDGKFEVIVGDGIILSDVAKEFFEWICEYINKYNRGEKIT